MEFESVIQIDSVMEVDPSDWGKALMEDLLLKAAKQVARDGTTDDEIKVELQFRITADADTRCLFISTSGEIEKALLTRLPMGFSDPARS